MSHTDPISHANQRPTRYRGWYRPGPRANSMSPLLAVVFILSLLAQGDTGQLSGTVVDANGAVVVSANVKLTSQSTSQVREVITGETGEFAFPLLPPGRYNVEVSANGFRTVLIDDANVNITQTTTILVHLDAATVAGVVTINAD